MTNLQKLFILLVFFSLVSCESETTERSAGAQQASDLQSAQPISEIDHLNAVLADSPSDFDALSALGDLYFESGRYQEAIQTYDRALAVDPMCADCLNDKGLCLFFVGDPAGALVSFDRANEFAPDYVNAWLSKGYVLISEKRYEEAMAPLNKVKQLDPQGAMAAEADKFLQIAVSRTFN